ncbi:hypothetical protein OUK_0312 [Helicobacter pylori R037c]|nr:hypothetical protein OUK_0312 [Helicobacter pylori R037c]
MYSVEANVFKDNSQILIAPYIFLHHSMNAIKECNKKEILRISHIKEF